MSDIITMWEDGWPVIQRGYDHLVRILENEGEPGFTSKEHMSLYTTVYNMCTQKPPYDYTETLYEEYRGLITGYIQKTVFPSLKKKDGVFLLRELERKWLNHKVMVRWLSRFFEYIERYYIARNSVPTLKEIAHTCFKEKVYTKFTVQLREVVLSMIDQERSGDHIERSVVKNLLSMVIDLGNESTPLHLYQKDFEPFMIKKTNAYYSIMAAKHISEDSCADYLLMAEESLMKEKDRAAHYCHSTSEPKLIAETQKVLLVDPIELIFEKENSGLQVLLEDNKVDDLSRMYRLFSNIDEGLKIASRIFKQTVKKTGEALVKEFHDVAKNRQAESSKANTGSQEQAFINKVIELHNMYSVHCDNCFMGNNLFHKALKEGFEDFLNKDISGMSSAELLSTFCDMFLQKGSVVDKLGDDAIEETIVKVVGLLAYLHDKDIFAEFTRKKLARRLLNDRSSNIEHEKLLLSKLKQQFGSYFTSKMEGMVTDLSLAKEVQKEFTNYVRANPQETQGTDVSVTVLTTGFWPTYKTLDFNIPAEFFYCIDTFKKFYKWKSSHRKLTWIFSLGNCLVTGAFGSKNIELNVSTYQAAALFLFNTTDKMTFKEIEKELKLPSEEVQRVLHSLACGKYKILLKEPNTRKIEPNDAFEFNSKFTDKMRRIKVPLPHFEEKKKVIEDVDKDRKFQIDAALVRIMKSRKVLGHQQLVLECVQILSSMFKPDIKVIKRRIEDLIHREYLERDADNSNTYKYLA
ncbi:hypothetical protein ACHQM5_026540 [Ranunculus cassubicifolius]